MRTLRNKLTLALGAVCAAFAVLACAVMISPANGEGANKAYAAGTSVTITTGTTFISSYNTSNGWNIQNVENWKTSGYALSFDYKNNTGAGFASFWFAGFAGSSRVTSQTTVTLSSNTCAGAFITDLGDGWYNLTINYADLGIYSAGGADGSETIDRIYFAGIGGNSLSVNNINTVAEEVFNPVTITTGTTYSSGWHIKSLDNWSTSGYAFSFDYKNNTGNTFTSFYFQLRNSGANRSNQIVVNMNSNTVVFGTNGVGTVTALSDGWYRVKMNYSEAPVTATGTIDSVYFAGIAGNSLSLNNIEFRAATHSDSLAAQLAAGAVYTTTNPTERRWNFQNVENWKTSDKALSFDYRNVSGAAFNITIQDANGTQRARQIAVNANNTVTFTGTGSGIVTSLGDNWYNVLINYADLGVYDNNGSNGSETLARMYFTGVGSNVIFINNINTVAAEKFNPVTINTGTTYSSGWHIESVADWKTSGKALSFDFKNNTGNTFTSFNFTGYGSSSAITGQIVVNMTYNMVMSGNNAVGKVTPLGDGWYRVLVNYEDLPVAVSGQTLTKIYFAGIAGNSLSLNNIRFKAAAHSEGLAAQLTAGCTYTSSNLSGRHWNFKDLENWKTSGKALAFDYKNGNGTSMNLTLQNDSAAIARQITVTYSTNVVSFYDDAGSVVKYGTVTPLSDGWYHVVIRYADLGVAGGTASNGEETFSKIYFTGVGSYVMYVNNIDTKASAAFTVSVTGGTGAGSYEGASSATVVANTPSAGQRFSHWEDSLGNIVSSNSSYTFTVAKDVALTAVYVNIYTVTVENGTIDDETEVVVDEGSTVAFVADDPETGYYFLNWTDGEDNVISDSATYEHTVTADIDLTANYRAYDGTKYTSSKTSYSTVSDEYYRVSFEYKLTSEDSSKRMNFYLWKDSSNYYGVFKLYGYEHYASTGSFWDSAIDGFTVEALADKYIRVTIDVADIAAGKTTGDPTAFNAIQFYPSWTDWDVYLRNITFSRKLAVTVEGGTGSGKYVPDSTATITADSPESGKVFYGWNDGTGIVSRNNSYTFTVENDVTMKAVYVVEEAFANSIELAQGTASYNVFYGDAEVYDSVTFDYKITDGPAEGEIKFNVTVCNGWYTSVAGAYKFFDDHTAQTYSGVTLTTGDDGFMSVTISLPSSAVNRIYVSYNTADGTIKNIKFNRTCTVSVTGGSGSVTAINGEELTVTANSASTGKVFACWKDGSGNNISNDSEYTFVVTDSISLNAYFADLVTVSASGGTVDGVSSKSIGDGSSVTLVAAAPSTGYYFLKWTNTAGATVATNATAVVTVDGATTYTANYRAFDGTKYATTPITAPGGEYAYSRVIFEYKLEESGTDKRINIYLVKNNANYYGMFKFYGYDYYLANGYFIENGGSFAGVTVEALEDKYTRVTIDIADIAKAYTTGNPSSFSQISLNLNYSDAVYFRNVTFTNTGNPFAMEPGASVRLKDPYGIRFRATIPWDSYDEDASYGIIIIPYDYVSTYNIDLGGDILAQLNSAGAKYRKLKCLPVRANSGDYYVQGSLTNIQSNNLTRQFVGIGYCYKDDEYTYVTSDSITACRRTIVSVAESTIKYYELFESYSSEKQQFLLTTTGSNNAAAVSGTFTVNAYDSMENILKDGSVPYTSAALTLSAAKGESEFGQILLTATAASANKAYVIIPSDLTHADGTTVLSKSKFELFNAYYTYVDSNHVILENYSYATVLPINKYFVNALVPFYAASKKGEAVFDRSTGDNQEIFIRFNVPSDQKAGTYTGTFRIYVVGIGYKDVPVSFTVRNFTLQENNYKTKFGINETSIGEMFGVYSYRLCDEYIELYDFLLDYNLNGGLIPAKSLYYGEEVIDEYIASLVEYYNNPKVTAIQINANTALAHYDYRKYNGAAQKSYDIEIVQEFDRNMPGGAVSYGTRSTLKEIAQYCVDNDINLFEKLYYRFNDEPNNPATSISTILSYNAIHNGIDYALSEVDFTGHEDIENSLRYLPYLVTDYPSQQVDDDYGASVVSVYKNNRFVDNVYYRAAYYRTDDYNDSTQAIEIKKTYITDFVPVHDKVIGHDADSTANTIRTDSDPATHLWWYTMVMVYNPYPSYAVNADQVINRSKAWATYYYGIEGELYYAANAWWEYHFLDMENNIYEYNFLDEDAVWNGEAVYFGTYEDGTLIYPNVSRYEGDFKYCPTLRLVTTSEGIDDYNYICYAQSLIDQMASGSAKTAAQNSLNTYVASMVTPGADDEIINDDAATLRTARANIIALIESLQ